jgi:predicted AlkP superfamily phosphohydrolase/phosphomutase
MTRVVLIGIDGLDADLLRVYGPSLPHLRRLMLESPFLELTSSFPPETAPAWASLYTGLSPSNHGMMSGMQNVGPHPPPQGTLRGYPACGHPISALKGMSFWEQASQAGKRVRVINPLLSYPLPQFFPAMPSSLLRPPTRHLTAWRKALQTLTLQQAACGLELFQHEPRDIFYQQFDTLEHVQHALWRYCDPGDVAYPGRNRHAGGILEFYRVFDTIIGHFRALLEADDVLVVVSAHGHGRRCAYRFNLNEWLRQQGLLVAHAHARRLLHWPYVLDWTKHHAHEMLARWPAMDFLSSRQRGHYSTHLIDQVDTIAQVVPLADGSPFGGVILNKDCIEREGKTYEAVRSMIVQRLRQLRVTGRPVVHWIDVRENICQGKFSEYYPDICFELQNEFAVNSAVYVPLVANEQARSQSLLSGEHRMHGVCLLGHKSHTLNIRETLKEPSVIDIAPTVLQLIGVESSNADGQAFAALLLPENAMVTTLTTS